MRLGLSRALFLDTRTLARRLVPLPDDSEVLVLDSGIARELATSGYNARRSECEEAARLLGVTALRDVPISGLARVEALPDPLRRRARHVVTENQRVLEAVQGVMGVLTSVSVTPTNAGSGLTFTVTDIGSGKTGSTTITTIQTQYEAWSGGAAFGADANGDGVDNGLAFLLGAANPNVSALSLLPTVSQSGGNLTMTFSMRNLANRGSASLNVEHSSNLGISDAWLASAVVPDVGGISPTVNGVTFNVTLSSPNNAVTATISSSEAASGKLFGRLKGNP